MRFSVWAPSAERVELVLAEPASTRLPMQPTYHGWWQRDCSELSGERDYAFALDGGPPLPDPRSPWQPHGVHGFSRTLEPAEFTWTDAQWPGAQSGRGVLGAVHYELHVGTFTPQGTLDAAAARLGHLVELGVEVVALMPVAAFPGRWGWGYDGVHPYAVHQPYGGPHALARFVDACHAHGLAVSLDVVYNHLGPVGNYTAAFGPYFTDRVKTAWGAALDLDGPDAGPVRRWVIDNALRWLRDFHVDALRLDATHALYDGSERHLLAELADEVGQLARHLGRPVELIAESDRNDIALLRPTAVGGLGMDGQWADDVHHGIHVALTGETQGYYADFAAPHALTTVLSSPYFHDGRWSTFRRQPWGTRIEPHTVDGRRFVVALQTHDQVGNRALGDRIHATLTPGQHAIGAALILLGPYTPMLFMGQEWAADTPWQYFTDFDPDEPAAAAVAAGRQAEFGAHGWGSTEVPNPQDPATRHTSVLRWAEPMRPAHARMLRWYRELIALRRAHPSNGRLDQVSVELDDGLLTMARDRLVVLANLGPRPTTADLSRWSSEPRVLLSWEPAQTRSPGRRLRVDPHGLLVLSR